MAKLTRPSSISVFASQALDPEITIFGDTTQSKDIDLLLNGADSERGWAVVGTNGTPPMEWFNAMGYALSYYSSYLMQQGIAEWVATQNYYINSYAVGSDGKLYRSKTGSGETPNVGNDPTSDSVNWESGLNVGSAIHAATAKATPVDADLVGIADSAASFALKKVTWANIKATILSSFGVMINSAADKATPIDADIIIIGDSAASNASKKVTLANLKTFISSAFVALTGNQIITGVKTFANIVINGTTKAAGYLYAGTVDPTNTTRLNYDGYLYAKKLYSEGEEVVVPSSPQSAKALVNFNAIPLSGTYSQTGTVITVTMTAHDMETGMIVNLDFTSGTATDGIDFVVTKTGVNTFTVVGKTSVTTSGNVTRNNYIKKAFNVTSITDNGVGIPIVNFNNNMDDTNFLVCFGNYGDAIVPSASEYSRHIDYTTKTVSNVSLRTYYYAGSANDTVYVDFSEVSVLIF